MTLRYSFDKFIRVVHTIDIKQTVNVSPYVIKINKKEFLIMLGFIIGLFIGCFIGMVIMCLMSIASHKDNK